MGDRTIANVAMSLIIVFNIIFILHGCAFVALGVYALIVNADIDPEKNCSKKVAGVTDTPGVEPIFTSIAYSFIGLIVYGAIIIIIGIVGCCGAIAKSKAALGVYVYFLVLYFLVYALIGVGVVVIAYVYDGQVKTAVESISKDKNTGVIGSSRCFREIERQLMCCGPNGPKDYLDNGLTLPVSCCALKPDAGNTSMLTGADAIDYAKCQAPTGETRHNTGCSDQLFTYFNYVMGAAFGLAAIEILLLILSCCLCCTTRKEDEKMLRHRSW